MGCLGSLLGFGVSAGTDLVMNQAKVKQALRGKTADQQRVIKYFTSFGCLSSLTGLKDSGFDELLTSKRASFDFKKQALNKIGLDASEVNEIAPICLEGFEDSEFDKVGSDGKWRSAAYQVTHLFFSSTQVYMHKMVFHLDKDSKEERTEEYFYKDITNFSTSTSSVETISTSGCTNKVSRTSIEVKEFALIVPGDKFTCTTQQDVERQIQAMKAKLREKKMQ